MEKKTIDELYNEVISLQNMLNIVEERGTYSPWYGREPVSPSVGMSVFRSIVEIHKEIDERFGPHPESKLKLSTLFKLLESKKESLPSLLPHLPDLRTEEYVSMCREMYNGAKKEIDRIENIIKEKVRNNPEEAERVGKEMLKAKYGFLSDV